MIKERQENGIHANISGVSKQRIECQWVCFGGTSSDSTAIKGAVFFKFDLTYFTFCLHLPYIPCDEGGSLEGWVQGAEENILA
jgi:hypothetical protein